MEARLTPIGQAVARYLTDHWQTSCELADISQIPGGASRETYRISIKTGDNLRGLILRRDPPSSLIDTERQLEFNTYQAVYRAGVVPVPEPIVLEEANPGELLRPFSIMAQISQGQATPAGLDEPAMQPHKAKLGQQMWGLLGNLASTPIATLNLTSFMQVPDHPAQHELNYWTEVIRQDALHPQPVAEATIRWLQRHLPEPSGQLCLVHGDYRTGNYLYTPQGDITAILDWEMAHIGDPLEDLAWSLDPLWSAQPEIAGRLLPRQQAVNIWQQTSSLQIDSEAFKWWQVFASMKALAIWISSNEDYVNGTTKEPILALAGWPLMDRQSRFLVDRLSGDGQFLYSEPLLDLA